MAHLRPAYLTPRYAGFVASCVPIPGEDRVPLTGSHLKLCFSPSHAATHRQHTELVLRLYTPEHKTEVRNPTSRDKQHAGHVYPWLQALYNNEKREGATSSLFAERNRDAIDLFAVYEGKPLPFKLSALANA